MCGAGYEAMWSPDVVSRDYKNGEGGQLLQDGWQLSKLVEG